MVGRALGLAMFALALVGLVMVVDYLRNGNPYDAADLWIGVEAAERLASGRPIYGWDLADPGEHVQTFHYPPVTAAVFLPFAAAGDAAPWIWRGLSVAALVLAVGFRRGVVLALMPPVVMDLVVCNGTSFTLAATLVTLRRPSRLAFFVLGLLIGLTPRTPFIALLGYVVLVSGRSSLVVVSGALVVGLLSLVIGQVGEFRGFPCCVG